MTRPLLGAELGNGEGGKEGHICDVSKAVPHLPSAVLPFSKYYSIEVVATESFTLGHLVVMSKWSSPLFPWDCNWLYGSQ